MNRIEHLLCVLGEECAEVAQRSSKAQRFGVHQIQIGHIDSNLDRIDYELQDLYAIVEMIREEVGESFGEPNRLLMDAKKIKVEKYMDKARDLDTLDTESSG